MMRELIGILSTVNESVDVYTADDVERMTGTAVMPPKGEYVIREIDIADTDLFKKNLLTRAAFSFDDYDNYHTELFVRMKKDIDKLPPIIALPNADGYEVIDGHHRLVLYVEAGMQTIKAFVPRED